MMRDLPEHMLAARREAGEPPAPNTSFRER